MSNDYQKLCREILFLHELKIREKLENSEIDLDEFLDFTQRWLILAISNDADSKRRNLPFDETILIEGLKKVQAVAISLLDKQKNSLPMMLIALAYHEKNIPIDSQNMDEVAKVNGWTSRHSGKKLKDKYNGFSDKMAVQKAKGKFTKEQLNQVKLL